MTRASVLRGVAASAGWGALAMVMLACHAPQPAEPRPQPAAADADRRSATVSTTRRSATVLPLGSAANEAPSATAPTQELAGQPPNMQRQASHAISLVARLRGWPQVSSLPIDEASESDLAEWLSAELAAQTPRSITRLQDHSLSLLGLLPAEFDSSVAVLGVFANTIQGVYLPTRSRIVLRRSLLPEAVRTILAHEVVHAYQDQLYGLGSKLQYQPRQGDSATAFHALAEGEACHVELEIARADLGSNDGDFSDERFEEQLEALASSVVLPSILQHGLVAPYRDGFRFVSYLRRIGHWELVDAVWRRGLASTSELLHPERWIDAKAGLLPRPAPKPSIEIRLAMSKNSVTEAKAQLAWEESLGEQGLRILLEETEPFEQAAELASSWRDDTIWLTRSRAGERLAWHLRTETRAQAVVLRQALRRLLYGSGRAPATCLRSTTANVALMAQNHDILVVASGRLDTSAGQRPRLPCTELVAWGRATLNRISSSN